MHVKCKTLQTYHYILLIYFFFHFSKLRYIRVNIQIRNKTNFVLHIFSHRSGILNIKQYLMYIISDV